MARSLNHPEVETLSLRDDPLLLVGHPKHGPTRARRARLEEVANWPLVFYERGSSDWTLTHSLFRRAGLVPNVALEVDTIETAKRMVDRGLGMAFLPQLAVGQELRSGKLVDGQTSRCRTTGPKPGHHSLASPPAAQRGAGISPGHQRSGEIVVHDCKKRSARVLAAHNMTAKSEGGLYFLSSPQLASSTPQDVHRHIGFATCAKRVAECKVLEKGKNPGHESFRGRLSLCVKVLAGNQSLSAPSAG